MRVDTLPEMICDFVDNEGNANLLLEEFKRQVAWVSRRYPQSYFVLGQKTDEAVADLAHRTFAICARVKKGRFPFLAREPFTAFVEEQFEGRAIRYHSFYAKISITRELLRDDYAHNVRRDPVLKFRADLYKEIGKVLKSKCDRIAQGRGVPPKWTVQRAGFRLLMQLDALEGDLRESGESSVEWLVLQALEKGGPMSQSQLTHLLETVVGAPAVEDPQWVSSHRPDVTDTMAVRNAVSAAWAELEDRDRELLSGLARGMSYDELIERFDWFKHRVAVTRAVTRCSRLFLDRVVAEIGDDESISERPKVLLERILEVLVEIVPDLSKERSDDDE
ncbi:MAG: hypothetical protein HN348_14165 [Proteobacteria bacterium]|nr:hypothetical protein [Pseudomonadota bacterium]